MTKTKTIRLRGRELLKVYGKKMYGAAKAGGVAYPTIHRYVTKPDSVKYISLSVLARFLRGLGLTASEIENMKFGDVFEVVDHVATPPLPVAAVPPPSRCGGQSRENNK